MDETEKTVAAQKLREDMRNERRGQPSTDKAGRGTQQNSPSPSRSRGSASGDPGGNAGQTSRDAKGTGSNERSAQSQPERIGPDYGRSLDYSGSAANRGDQTAKYSGLERLDAIPERPEKRPVGRPRKEVVDAASSVKKAIFKKATVLTEKEAEEYRPRLMSALQSYGEYYDKYIRWRTQEVDMPDIWGNITDFEAGALANIWIRRGMKSAYAAEAVRNAVNGEDYVSVGVMFVPRIIATTEQMKKAPPRQRKRKRREAAN